MMVLMMILIHFNSVRGHLLDKRPLFESGHLLGHLQ